MKLSISFTQNALHLSVPATSADAEAQNETYTLKPGIAVAANLRQALQECKLLQQPRDYERVVAVVDTPIMIIPAEEFDAAAVPQLYRYINAGRDADDVLTTNVHALNAVVAFAVNKDLHFVLADTFRYVQIVPYMADVLVALRERSAGGFQEKLMCFFADKQLHIATFRKGRLRFYSAFSPTTVADSAYYILNTWQQLAMRPTDIICLCGDAATHTELTEQLQKFVKNVQCTELQS